MLLAIIIGVLLLLFGLGVPVAFSMGLSALLYILISGDVPLMVASQRMLNSLDSFPLMAIPFFVLAGQLMNSSGATERIFKFASCVVGPIRGGLGHVNVLASMLFAGMSGSAVSDASGLGAVEIKAMTQQGYDKNFSAAVTGATSIIGPIIPPSIPMVVYGSMVGVSVGRLFLGGIIPGILLGVAFMVYVWWVSKKRNYPYGQKTTLSELGKEFISSFPALLMPILLLGGIVSGICTPTEAAALSALYAVILGVVYKSITFKSFLNDLISSAKMVSELLIITAAAAIFSLALTRQQVPQMATEALVSLADNPLMLIMLINVLLLFIGCFIEGTAAILMLGPILAAATAKLGIDPVLCGVLLVLDLMIGLITPPVGMVIFVLSRVAGVSVYDFTREVRGFLVMALAVVILISLFPSLVTAIPNALMGTMR